jgi:prepilin-type processing-associated H-X9-DG protein
LRALGHAVHDFAGDHDNGLPAAGIDLGYIKISWDALVVQYLNQRSANSAIHCIVCPSDPAPHNGVPRSYAMSGNDMTPEHWPPGGDSPTGVGLFWDDRTVLLLVNRDALQKPELLPALKLSAVPAPADTLLLTDFIDPNNTMGNPRQTTVFNASQQRQFFKDAGARFHRSRFNYLMVDGHVEWLSPLQTAAVDGTTGIWSLKK